MKVAETKTVALHSSLPRSFFTKGNSQDFFSRKTSETPFFSKNYNSQTIIQTKLTIGQPNDKYEQEADAMADKVVHQLAAPESLTKKETAVQAKPLAAGITPLIQTKCTACEQEEKLQKKEEEDLVQESPLEQRKPIFESNAEKPDDEKNLQRKYAECEKEDDLMKQKKIENNSTQTDSTSIESNLNSSKGNGSPLPEGIRAQIESSFDADFSNVRIHNDSSAVQMSKNLNAQAFTHDKDIYFNAGKYDANSTEGKHLLAHELTHVIQQNSDENVIRRDELKPAAKAAPPTLKYKNAEKENKKYSQPDSLGWESKLGRAAGGKYKAWLDLWKAGKFDEFADAVAQFQIEQGFKRKSIDGILGLGTWARVGGYGEAIAGITDVLWEKSETTCTIATEERIKRGYKLATGKEFQLPKDKSAKIFNVILQTIESRMGDVDEVYRGTGAPGAMVYAGFATIVNEADIWTGGLLPGAPMQVWRYRDSYNLLRKGVIEYKKKGVTRTRPLRSDDADFYGTSFVFARYDNPASPTKMLVRHFGSPEWHSKAEFEVWVGANII